MTHQIALITDSTCDIPFAWRKQYEIYVVPLTIIFGDEQYLDGVELTAEQFYERLPNELYHPTTSQPTPRAFLDAYHQAAAYGAKEIVVFTISGGMSGTIISAQQAAQSSPIPVYAVDSKNNSMGLGWQVIAAARAREAGGGLETILMAAEKVRQRMVYYVALDTIDYLSKGGRINDAVKFLDSILHIKPLIYVKPENGTVGASLPARSRKNSLESLYKEFFRQIKTDREMHIAVMHNNAQTEAHALTERIQNEYSCCEIVSSIVSPVLGVHTGPGAIALCGYAEEKE